MTALILSGCVSVSGPGPGTTRYVCENGTSVAALYPDTDTARLYYQGRVIDMKIALSADGARYVGGGWQWWTKGMTEGNLSPIKPGEPIASAQGTLCTVAHPAVRP